ncbi:hypothetical protein SEA_CAMERICO_43 [Gordonia phage Camerico]|nr:hypothetical protein SEA_CAMERICO_43 [Gordonia phage Camerico]
MTNALINPTRLSNLQLIPGVGFRYSYDPIMTTTEDSKCMISIYSGLTSRGQYEDVFTFKAVRNSAGLFLFQEYGSSVFMIDHGSSYRLYVQGDYRNVGTRDLEQAGRMVWA